MRTRRLAVLSLVVLVMAGCANNGGAAVTSSATSGSSAPVESASPPWPVSSPTHASSPGTVSSPGSVASSGLATVPSHPVPSASGPETISGTVSAGVEPHCLILQDDKGSHVLIFPNPALRAAALPGAKVTLGGHSEPTMMTTCQQGVAFIVTSVGKG